MPVHDVHVDEVGPAGLGHRQRVRQAREVGREEGRSDADFHDLGAGAPPSAGRDTVRETTSRLESG